MKNILLIIILIVPFFGFISNDSTPKDKQFRKDYNNVAVYNTETGALINSSRAKNTFIFNINENADVMHVKPDGTNIIYYKVFNIVNGETFLGHKYVKIEVIDGDGVFASLQLFDNSQMGLRMIYSNITINFKN